MIIKVPDLTDEVRSIDFAEAAAGLSEVLAASPGWSGQHFERDLDVHAEAYRHGTDVYLGGSVDGVVKCTCRRCLDDFEWPLQRTFRFLLVKAGRVGHDDGLDDDAGLDHYEGDEIDLSRLARFQPIRAYTHHRIVHKLPNKKTCSKVLNGVGAVVRQCSLSQRVFIIEFVKIIPHRN